jgi:hypothetical protein
VVKRWSVGQILTNEVESKTPGLDGHPLAFAPIYWTVSKTISEIRFRKRWIDLLPSLLPPANLGCSLNRDFGPRVLALHEPTGSVADHPINWLFSNSAHSEKPTPQVLPIIRFAFRSYESVRRS